MNHAMRAPRINRAARSAALAWLLLGAMAACAWLPQQHTGDDIPDEEVIAIARSHPMAQAFLELHPEPEILIDRSGALAVDFRVTTRRPRDTTDLWQGIRLRVFVDPRSRQPTKTLIQCDTTVVEKNVEEYLERYSRLQTCP